MSDSGSRRTVLVVDDSPLILKAVRHQMELLGWEALPATSVREAVALLGDRTLDLLIVDLILADESGLELIDIVRRQPRPVPILAMSGTTDRDMAQAALFTGAVRYLAKPVSSAALATAVQEIFDNPTSVGTIMLVDDDPVVLRVLGEAFRAAAWTVIVAQDMAEALSRMAEASIQAVVTDSVFDHGSAIDLVRALRQGGYGGPVLVRTSTPGGSRLAGLADQGAVHCESKATSIADLCLLARKMVASPD